MSDALPASSAFRPAPFPPDEAARTAAVRRSGILHADRALLLHGLVGKAASLLRSPMAAVSIVHDDVQTLISTIGIESGDSARSTSFCGHTILAPFAPLCVLDASKDARFTANPLVVGAPGLRFYAAAPLVDRDGHALGALCVFDTVPHASVAAPQMDGLTRLAAEVVALAVNR